MFIWMFAAHGWTFFLYGWLIYLPILIIGFFEDKMPKWLFETIDNICKLCFLIYYVYFVISAWKQFNG